MSMDKRRKIRFWHGMDKERWDKTQKQGFLLHERATEEFPNMSPCTYLAVDRAEAEQYGEFVVEVWYNPFTHPDMNNYNPESWQLRVYEQIPIKDVKLPFDGAIMCGNNIGTL